MLFANFYKTIL